MSESLPPEIEDLHAYLDGQLGPESRRRVEAWLADNPEGQRQRDDYEAIRLALRERYDPVLQEPVPPRLLRRPRPWRQTLIHLAAGLVIFALGLGIGLRLHGPELLPLAHTPSVVREAAMAYAVYTPEVRHPVEVPGDQEAHLISWLTKRMGAPVRPPRLEELGYRLVGGRLLASDAGPGALFMYENGQGQRVVLYLCQNERSGQSTAFRFAQQERISVFYWFEGAFSYALAGELDRTGLRGLAETVYRQTNI